MAAFRIGALASQSGVSRDTIRYYERYGLLGKALRTPAGYRVYTEPAVKRLRVIGNARRFGFSLAEIRSFMQVREAGGAPCQQVRTAAEERLRGVERQIEELGARRDAMRATLAQWNATLSRTPQGAPAGLLEGDLNLPDAPRGVPRRR
jgi:DNA-binding transcriptional MerR regulator